MTTTTAQPHPCTAGCPVHQGSHKPVQALHQIAEPTIILTESDAILLDMASELLEQFAAKQRQRGNTSAAEAAECSAHAVQRLGVAMLAALSGAQPAPAAQTLVRYCPECGHVGEVGKDHHDCCPDGSAAFMVPEKYAQDLRAGFKALLATHRPQDVQREAGDLYYLQDARWSSRVGNSPSWWRDGGGYTTNLDEAERFTFDAAMSQHRCRDTDLPWLCCEIDKLRRPTVDCQYMPRSWDEQRAAIAASATQGE